MIDIYKKIDEVNIICPKKRIYHFYMFSRYMMNIKRIYFLENNDCNLYLIDQENIDFIKNNKKEKAKFIIFLWNGYFDYKKYFKDKKFENNKNITLFFIGNVGNVESIGLNEINLKSKTKVYGLSLLRILNLKLTFLFTIIKLILHPLRTLQNLCFNKLIFVGSGLIKSSGDFSNFDKNFNILSEMLKEYSLIKHKDDKEKYFEKISSSKKFNLLENFEKYYLLQCIFRDILLINLLKFKNFRLFENDKNLSIQRSFLFKKNIFLDLGSKIGSEKYYERKITYEVFNKDHISIQFFKNNNITQKIFENKNKLMIKFIRKIKNLIDLDISGKELVYNINAIYLKIIQNEND